MNHEYVLLLAVPILVALGAFGQWRSGRRLAKQVDALVRNQGVAWPGRISPGVMLLAQDPGRKIAAIKLHLEQNPGLSIREAKEDVKQCKLEGEK